MADPGGGEPDTLRLDLCPVGGKVGSRKGAGADFSGIRNRDVCVVIFSLVEIDIDEIIPQFESLGGEVASAAHLGGRFEAKFGIGAGLGVAIEVVRRAHRVGRNVVADVLGDPLARRRRSGDVILVIPVRRQHPMNVRERVVRLLWIVLIAGVWIAGAARIPKGRGSARGPIRAGRAAAIGFAGIARVLCPRVLCRRSHAGPAAAARVMIGKATLHVDLLLEAATRVSRRPIRARSGATVRAGS